MGNSLWGPLFISYNKRILFPMRRSGVATERPNLGCLGGMYIMYKKNVLVGVKKTTHQTLRGRVVSVMCGKLTQNVSQITRGL